MSFYQVRNLKKKVQEKNMLLALIILAISFIHIGRYQTVRYDSKDNISEGTFSELRVSSA